MAHTDIPLPQLQLMENLTEVIQKLRLQNGSEVARRTGLSRDNISRYLRGTSLPTTETLAKLARGLRVEPSDLIPCLFDGTYPKELIMARKPRGKAVNPSTKTASPLAVFQSDEDPTKAWLRVNMMVPWNVAAEIVKILKDSEAENVEANRAASG